VTPGTPSPSDGTVSRASMTGDLFLPQSSGTWTCSRSSWLRWTTCSSSRARTRTVGVWCALRHLRVPARQGHGWTRRTATACGSSSETLQPEQPRAARDAAGSQFAIDSSYFNNAAESDAALKLAAHCRQGGARSNLDLFRSSFALAMVKMSAQVTSEAVAIAPSARQRVSLAHKILSN
jgi:hypothetical protein